jgi:hypothetical protein
MVVRGSPGVAFTAVHGAVIGDELIDAVLHLARADVGRLTTFAAAVPDGYRLTSWSEPTPSRYVESYARAKRVIADAPNRFPPPTPRWTAAEVREAEHRRRVPGVRSFAATYAAANTGMHAVNRDLGFREHRRRDLVRLPIRAGGVVRPS